VTLYACGTSVNHGRTMNRIILHCSYETWTLGTDQYSFSLLYSHLCMRSSILQFSQPCFPNHACPRIIVVALSLTYVCIIYLIMGAAFTPGATYLAKLIWNWRLYIGESPKLRSHCIGSQVLPALAPGYLQCVEYSCQRQERRACDK
jgi:hypothetical protein